MLSQFSRIGSLILKDKKRPLSTSISQHENLSLLISEDISSHSNLTSLGDDDIIYNINNDNINNSNNSNNSNADISEINNNFPYSVHILSDNNNNKDMYNLLYSNKIYTSKYTYINAIPKILLEQFSKYINIYFLIIAFCQFFKEISNSNGQPIILFPLTTVVVINGVKDFLEDLKRRKSDYRENTSLTLVYSKHNKKFEYKKWENICIGDILKIKEDETFPADCVYICGDGGKCSCLMETKNIDGETSLKEKKGIGKSLDVYKEEDIDKLKDLFINCIYPNEYVYEFDGKINFNDNKKNKSLYILSNNFLLRGAKLKYTKYIYCIVVYVGHTTKIMLNSPKPRSKQSKVEYIMNKQIIAIFIMLLLISLIASLLSRDSNILIKAGVWTILINNIVPISLLVTMEMIKFFQGMFISWDINLCDIENQQLAKVQTSTLNDELGQVKFIFSDKTGTLTKNYMQFKACSIYGEVYGIDDNDISNDNNNISNIEDIYGNIENYNFYSKKFENDLKAENNVNIDKYTHINYFLLCLSICHSVNIEEKLLPKIIYKSSSPDESAFVYFSRKFGYIFYGRDINNTITLLDKEVNKKTYNILYTLEYSSERKRMSIIVKMKDIYAQEGIFLFTKGADNVIIDKLGEENKDILNKTISHLLLFASKGLRTLMFAYKKLDKKEFSIFEKKYLKALNNPIKKTKLIDEAFEYIEKELILLGATGVEDKLQDNVTETIDSFIKSGIKVWMLTGDKSDTAKSISFSCKLIDHSYYLFEFPEIQKNNNNKFIDYNIFISEKKNEMREKLNKFYRDYIDISNSQNNEEKKFGLIISLNDLNVILSDTECSNLFYLLAIRCNSVLCCRVTPKQKAQVVKLIQSHQPSSTTLAIGDGANDVNMISTASVGVGILGKEGLQAARAADYCLGEFRFLKRLLFVHGREAYRRNSFAICYNFYKNFLFVMPQFWFGMKSLFSGQILYDPWMLQMFNLTFTSLPILWFGVYDREVSYSTLMEDHRYYTQGIIAKLFHPLRFWKWIFYGIFQALLLSVYSFNYEIMGKSGKIHDLACGGSIIYFNVVLIANVKILYATNTHSIISGLLIVFSILSYWVGLWIMNNGISFFNFNNFQMIYNSPIFYLSSFFLVFFSIIIDKGIDIFCKIFNIIQNPLEININLYNKEEIYKEMIEFDQNIGRKNSINNDFKGSAFSERDK